MLWHVDQPDRDDEILDAQQWDKLSAAHQAFNSSPSPAYDEVLHEVVERVQRSESVGKSDIGALLLWKRLRADTKWARRLMVLEDREVRKVTAEAVLAVNDASLSIPEAAAQGRKALSSLPGFVTGDALASAVLVAAAPERMSIYDRRAHAGLEKLGLTLSSARGRYKRYMQLVEDLRKHASARGMVWSARDVDLALYQLGG
jgi:hypothetical protein